MEYECATDSGCHWCSRSIQVRPIFTNQFDEEFSNDQTKIDFFSLCRDPRTRRLQEKQQQQQQKTGDAVPEKLSFKEKMKMFALESGENQTPKDKLKISRAQRDIDAVH